SPEGQWYHDILASGLLPRPVLDAHDLKSQWDAARSALQAPIARNRNATHYMASHEARILFGTDTPSAPTYANLPGLNDGLEMHQLVEAGVSPGKILRAATLDNAQALGLEHDLGSVQAGKLANLLLLREDPSRTIEAYDGIVKVIVRGKVLDRATLA